MRKDVFVSVIVFLFCGGSLVEGLKCQNGRKVKAGPLTPFNSFKTTNCLNGSSCLSVNVGVKKGIASGE